jgi:hypothetical protein
MASKPRVWALFLALLGVAGLGDRIMFGGPCSSGCHDLYSFYKDSEKWVWVSSAPETGYHARIGYGASPLPNTDTELTCYAKPASNPSSCYHICSSCPPASEPCQLDNCYASNGNAVSYTCYRAYTD